MFSNVFDWLFNFWAPIYVFWSPTVAFPHAQTKSSIVKCCLEQDACQYSFCGITSLFLKWFLSLSFLVCTWYVITLNVVNDLSIHVADQLWLISLAASQISCRWSENSFEFYLTRDLDLYSLYSCRDVRPINVKTSFSKSPVNYSTCCWAEMFFTGTVLLVWCLVVSKYRIHNCKRYRDCLHLFSSWSILLGPRLPLDL